MKTSIMFTLLALGLVFLPPTVSFASVADFSGNWINVDANTRGITRLTITPAGNIVSVHAWGQCHPQDCDWGQVKGVAYAPDVSSDIQSTAKAVTAVYTKNFAVTTLVMHARRGRLRVEAFTRFTDNSNRSHYTQTYNFKKTSGPGLGAALMEDCIPFNYSQARVQQVNNRWKIIVGNMYLLDFANKSNDARQALRIITGLRMNKQCFVGRPDPSFEYYLSNNSAPSGSISGEDCVNFNPHNIQVKRIQNRWKIVDGSHWMFDFGDKLNEARQSFRIIKKYGFRRSCFVGRPNPPMSYLKR